MLFAKTLFLLVPVFVWAQVLTLQQSIDKALQNHPDIKAFTLKVEQSRSSYRAAFADYLPQVSLSANYNATQTFVFPVNGQFHTIDDSGWNAGVYVKQKIWDFSQTSSKVDAAKVDKKISALSLEELKALLVYKVKSLYELMVVQNEAVKVRKQDLQTKEAYYEQALALVKQGLKTEADATRFLSAVSIAKANLAEAKGAFEKARNTLSLYIAENIPEDVTLETDVLYADKKPAENIEGEILQENYQLKISAQNIQKNLLLHKAAKASHFGSIDAIGSYTHIDTLNSYDSKIAGVVLTLPLYSGGRVSAEAQKAKIGAQIAREQKASALLNLKDEVESLLIDIQKYDKTIAARKAQLDSAEATKRVLDGRYKEGLSTYIEVLDATSLVLNAKLALLEAYYLKSMALHRLEYLKGKSE